MTVWKDYPNLSSGDLRTLVAVTAQVLFEHAESGADLPTNLLQQSPRTSASAIQSILERGGAVVTGEKVQRVLEDETLATRACQEILNQVRTYPALADRVAVEFEVRRKKMTGVELVLLTGALVILAMRIKRIELGKSGGTVDFEPSGQAVKTFVVELVNILIS